jgi:hypothetical protein
MGELKRRVRTVKVGPCFYLSSRPAEQSFFSGNHWDKPAARLGLRDFPTKTSVARCYMSEPNSRDGGISS